VGRREPRPAVAIPIANYWFRVRERSLAIQLAGDRPDIHLPLEYISVEDEFRLEKALVPEQVSDDIPADVDEPPEPGARGGEQAGTGETAGHDGDPTTGTGGADPTDDDTHEFEWVGTETATDGQAENSTTGDRN